MIIMLALVVLMVLFYALNTNFLKRYNIVTMSQNLAPYALMALGVTFVIATGGIDLSIGTVCIASAVLAGHMYTRGILPLWATIPVMITIGGIFGLLNGVLVAKFKVPAFIATLGTMLVSRGLSAIIVAVPNIFYPTGSWYNRIFSNYEGFPIGFIWVIAFTLICMYLMYKNKIGRYILSIGSNEEATRLSGINTEKYKLLAYVFSGIGAGIAAIFWSAASPTVASATGNGMELDAIAGVYIGGTSSAGGIASVAGSVIGSMILVVIRNGLNFFLAKLNLNVNATYVTFVLTGIIVVGAILIDIIKGKNEARVKPETAKKKLRREFTEKYEALQKRLDDVLTDASLSDDIRSETAEGIRADILSEKTVYRDKLAELKAEKRKPTENAGEKS